MLRLSCAIKGVLWGTGTNEMLAILAVGILDTATIVRTALYLVPGRLLRCMKARRSTAVPVHSSSAFGHGDMGTWDAFRSLGYS